MGSRLRPAYAATVCAVFLAFSSTACLSSGIRSSGAVLPQTTNEFDDGELRATVIHHCSSGRCTSLTAAFENLTAAPIEVIPGDSTLSRAGETFPLALKGGQTGKETVVVPPNGKAEADLVPVSPKNRATMSYVQATEVWCSLKVDNECQNPSKGEAMCAGFSRYYYQTYVTTGGWLSLKFTYKKPDKSGELSTIAPNFLGSPPPVRLEPSGDAPNWISGSDEVVFHKVECDAKCRCLDVGKRRNFFADDKFLPTKD